MGRNKKWMYFKFFSTFPSFLLWLLEVRLMNICFQSFRFCFMTLSHSFHFFSPKDTELSSMEHRLKHTIFLSLYSERVGEGGLSLHALRSLDLQIQRVISEATWVGPTSLPPSLPSSFPTAESSTCCQLQTFIRKQGPMAHFCPFTCCQYTFRCW